MVYRLIRRQELEVLLLDTSLDLFEGLEPPPDGPGASASLIVVPPGMLAVGRPAKGEPPTVIVVPANERRELLAWAATYFPTYRPFTAHFHVITPEVLQALENVEVRRVLDSERRALIGLILGEAVSSGGVSTSPTVADCRATTSFALGRGVVLGLEDAVNDELQQDGSGVAASKAVGFNLDAALPVAVIRALIENDARFTAPHRKAVAHACRDIKAYGEVSRHLIGQLLARSPARFDRLSELGSGDRETRVMLVDQMLNALLADQAGIEPEAASFLAGYIVSRAAPGSMEYFRLLLPFQRALPAAVMWYGLCAGLYAESEVLERSPVGRLVGRDLFRRGTYFEPPTCDIARAELEQWSTSPSAMSSLGNPLTVEVVPGIVVQLNGKPQQQVLGRSEVRDLVEDLEVVQQRVYRVMRSLDAMAGHQQIRAEQRELPSKKPRTKSKT